LVVLLVKGFILAVSLVALIWLIQVQSSSLAEGMSFKLPGESEARELKIGDQGLKVLCALLA
jgi:hypothetical protein